MKQNNSCNTFLPFSNTIRVKALDLFRRTNQLNVYREYIENQFQFTKEDIEAYQKRKFEEIFMFHYKHNVAYRSFIDNSNFDVSKTIDINSVPIQNKAFFKENGKNHSVQKEKSKVKHSGGSTGTPLTYYLNKDSLESMWPGMWRAFDVYNIKPCDKVMMIAGPSLFNNRTIKRKLYDYINRFTIVSAFDLSDKVLRNAYRLILQKDIKAIYGYTSSVLILLQFLKKNNFRVKLTAIYTTSETFIPSIRKLAKEYCQCDVIDTYGANDGGVQAFECPSHQGYHLNFERCLVEIIDGEIVLTDLLNRATPFIRYRVGDCTSQQQIIKDKCDCGRSLFRIKDISGRINQYVEDIDGKKIHSEFFGHLFGYDSHIFQIQIIQNANKLYINIVHDKVQKNEEYLSKYVPLVEKRIKMPFEFQFNQPVKKSRNMKTPIFWKNEE